MIEDMRRYHEELPIVQRQQREGLKLGTCLSPGYYRKRDAHDCGRPRCGICHPQKRLSVSLETCCNAFLAFGWTLIVFGLWCIWPASLAGY